MLGKGYTYKQFLYINLKIWTNTWKNDKISYYWYQQPKYLFLIMCLWPWSYLSSLNSQKFPILHSINSVGRLNFQLKRLFFGCKTKYLPITVMAKLLKSRMNNLRTCSLHTVNHIKWYNMLHYRIYRLFFFTEMWWQLGRYLFFSYSQS